MTIENWRALAVCVDSPELFFKDDEEGEWEDIQAAKAMCAGCPVESQCKDFAVRNLERFGVWRTDFALSSC